jgi:hypothetical protein
VRANPARPVALHHERYTPDRLVSRLYLHAFSRDPEPTERRVAVGFLNTTGAGERISSESLEDLLWAIFQSPEFQFIH